MGSEYNGKSCKANTLGPAWLGRGTWVTWMGPNTWGRSVGRERRRDGHEVGESSGRREQPLRGSPSQLLPQANQTVQVLSDFTTVGLPEWREAAEHETR